MCETRSAYSRTLYIIMFYLLQVSSTDLFLSIMKLLKTGELCNCLHFTSVNINIM